MRRCRLKSHRVRSLFRLLLRQKQIRGGNCLLRPLVLKTMTPSLRPMPFQPLRRAPSMRGSIPHCNAVLMLATLCHPLCSPSWNGATTPSTPATCSTDPRAYARCPASGSTALTLQDICVPSKSTAIRYIRLTHQVLRDLLRL